MIKLEKIKGPVDMVEGGPTKVIGPKPPSPIYKLQAHVIQNTHWYICMLVTAFKQNLSIG